MFTFTVSYLISMHLFSLTLQKGKKSENKHIKVNKHICCVCMLMWMSFSSWMMSAPPLLHLCSDNVEVSRLNVSHLVYVYGPSLHRKTPNWPAFSVNPSYCYCLSVPSKVPVLQEGSLNLNCHSAVVYIWTFGNGTERSLCASLVVYYL